MYLTKEQMEKLPTRRLLAYKKKHLNLGARPRCASGCTNYLNGFIDSCVKSCGSKHVEELIEFDKSLKNIKDILNTREHIERKGKC